MQTCRGWRICAPMRKTSFKLPMKGCCDFYNTDTIFIREIQTYCAKCPKQSDKVCPFPAVSQIIFKSLNRIWNKS